MANGDKRTAPAPVVRKLRVFATDPGMTARFETAIVNEMTLAIPWEQLEPGPRGEYVAIVDEDEAGNKLYEGVDLNQPEVLAQDGLSPSDGNPQFHQQMVYAVAMRTIRNFERALGRSVHWPPRPAARGAAAKKNGDGSSTYEKQLKIYPHFMADPNAFYDPERGFCFGYFRSDSQSAFPGTMVFTCLSQDIIAHELAHALLMGMNISFEGTHPDVMALHEAFADLVALLQHFWPSEVLQYQIAAIRGHLESRSQLGAVGLQMGQAMNMPDGLRNALGRTDKNGAWQARIPDPKAYETEMEPHARGDILVAAVFEALKKVYESRVAALRRIATKGTGILPQGSVHPDLVNRFAHEASCAAQHVLHLLICALDYIPPVEMTFGDFLRGVVTADYDVSPIDDSQYRVAFVDAFRSHGIVPEDVGTLSLETLLWPRPAPGGQTEPITQFVKARCQSDTPWTLPRDRKVLWELLETRRQQLHAWLSLYPKKRIGPIDLGKPFEVQSFHPRQRSDEIGGLGFQWVIKLVQNAGARKSPKANDGGGAAGKAGVTLLVDGDTGIVRYQIDRTTAKARKPKTSAQRPVLGQASALPPVSVRRLRVFAFDPSMGTAVETAGINEALVRVPWERDGAGKDALAPGPVGEYVEVVDRDPASGCFYEPIDLNDPHVMAQHGLAPSESNPQFHQQMVYAVAMRTIRNFERALGRLALWRSRVSKDKKGKLREEYVQRLRIYPHALREANAYYSPDKTALLFGYFPAAAADGIADAPRLTVFTCLSHDIIAHEVTHALLDGMHRRFSEASNPDVLAFHEAFADIVALFQHFSLPEVLRHQIASTRGDLASQSRLGELAQQFGQAIGKRGALRNAIGGVDPESKQWKRLEGEPGDYQKHQEPHDRGAVLVAAVFDAFLSIYKGRVADMLRIASEGTGVLPAGNLHPDLVNRLTEEASRSAAQVLDMCIRALDYCPPVDITFGDYLRALVTADYEYDPVDDEHRRVAFMQAFRRRGIVPEKVQAFSVDGLLWRSALAAPDEDEKVIVGIVKEWAKDIRSWALSKSRKELFELTRERRMALHKYLHSKLSKASVVLAGIDPTRKFEVHSLRPSMRTDLEGHVKFQWIVELTQRIAQNVDGTEPKPGSPPDYYFRGGCTLLVDAQTGQVRYSIKKKLNDERKARQRRYFLDEGNRSLAATYFGGVGSEEREPFAMLHRH